MKKSVIYLLAVVLLISAALAVIPEQPNIKVRDSTTYDSTLIQEYFVNQVPDPAEPGGYVELRWRIDNVGMADADNVTFELLPEYPFKLWPGTSAIQKFGRMYSGQIGEDGIILYYKLLIDPDAVEGNNEIRLRYHVNNLGWVEPDPFLVRIQTNDAIVNVDNINVTPSRLQAGQQAKVDITLTNAADSDIKDLQLRLQTTDTPFTTVSSINTQSVKLMKSGASQNFTYYIITDSDAVSGVYKVPVEITYRDHIGNQYNTSGSVAMIVYDRPKYMVYIENSDVQMAAQSGHVYVTISNIGSTQLRYLRAHLLESDDYIILSSPTIYLGNLDSDDFETADFEILLKNKTNNRVMLPVELQYSDVFNNDYRDTPGVPLRVFSPGEKIKLGLVSPPGPTAILGPLFTGALAILFVVFMIYMLFDIFRSKRLMYQKILWAIVILTVIGSIIYFFFGRKKEI